MHKWIMFVLFVGAGVVGLGALFNQVAINAKENAPDPDADKKIVFAVSNFKFDKPEYTVKAGESKQLVMQVKEGLHEVGIADLDVKLTKTAPNKEIKFDKPGTYEVKCVLPCGSGHEQMVAKLIVQ